MYLWQRSTTREWLRQNEDTLNWIAGPGLAIIERPDRKMIQLEVASESRSELDQLSKQFGGTIQRLPRDWLKRFAREQKTKPVKLGKRLIIASSRSAGYRNSTVRKQPLLVIPAEAAFGTGGHVTTSMSLRLLEKITRSWKSNWFMLDLGTGSGILALAAKRLGATPVIAIDRDPVAISTAKENARRNKIRGVQFRIADLRHYRLPFKADVVTANLFSDLLIELLPKLKATRRLILSGILREDEIEIRRALTRHKMDVVVVRRRGKWVAILAARS